MDSSNDDGICKKCYYDWNHCECQKGQNFADIIHLQQYLNQSGKTLSSLQAAWNFLWALDSEMSLELMEDADDEAMWSQLLTGEIENVGEASMAYAKFLSREKGKSSEELGENQLVFIASSRHEKKIREALAQGNILESARLTEELKTLQDAAALGDLTEVCRIIASLPTSSQSKRIRVSIVEAPTRTPTPTPSSAMITTLDAPLVETPMLTSAAPLVETRKLTPTPMPTSDVPLVEAQSFDAPTTDSLIVERTDPEVTLSSAMAQNLELTRAVSLAKSYWEVLKTHLESKIKEEEEEMDSDEEEMDSDVEIILEKKGIEEDMKNDDEDDDEDDEDFDEDDIKDKDYDPDEDIDEEDDEEEDEDEDQDEDEEKEEDEEMKMALTSTLEVENEGKAEAEAEAEAEAKVVAEAEVAVSASTSQMTALDLAQEGYEESCACDDLTPCGQEGCLQRSDCLDWTFEDLITSPEVAKGSEKLEEEKNCSATLRTLALSDDPEVKKMLEIYSKIVVEICEDDVNNEKLRKERLERCERRLKYWSRERKLKGIRCMTGYLGLNSKMGDDLLKLKKMGNELLRVIDGEESDSI